MRWHPRWFAWLYAHLGGYFWLPCPVCGEPFGGQESSHHAIVHEGRPTVGKVVCRKPACVSAARKTEERWLGWTEA